MREMGLLQPQKLRKCRATNSQTAFPRYPNRGRDLEGIIPDQVWCAEITSIRLQQEFVFLAVVMEVINRNIRGRQLSRSFDHIFTSSAPQRALVDHVRLIDRSEQGVPYTPPWITPTC